MNCPVCNTQHDDERIGIAKEVSGLKQDVQAFGSFCPIMDIWIVKSMELWKESAGIVTFERDQVTVLQKEPSG